MEHLSRQTLDSLLKGELARSQVALAVRHLLTECPACREIARAAYLEHPISSFARVAA
jgi:predicted anti-sigma-YlaC factor YlaD